MLRSLVGSEMCIRDSYRAGKKGALNFLVGQVMKETRGRADPRELGRMVAEYIDKGEV